MSTKRVHGRSDVLRLIHRDTSLAHQTFRSPVTTRNQRLGPLRSRSAEIPRVSHYLAVVTPVTTRNTGPSIAPPTIAVV